jgi:hypothetical protein
MGIKWIYPKAWASRRSENLHWTDLEFLGEKNTGEGKPLGEAKRWWDVESCDKRPRL